MAQVPLKTPEEVARESFEGVTRHDADAVVADFAEDSTDEFVAVGIFRGREAIRQFFIELFAAVPDFAMTVERVVADGETAVVQWQATGSFTGQPFQGIQATGRRIELKGVDVMQIRDGLMRYNTIYYDGASFARQIGMLPAQGSRADRMTLAVFNAMTRLRRLLSR